MTHGLSTGCEWAALPKKLPPRSTVNDGLLRCDHDGVLGGAATRRMATPRTGRREANLTAAVIDSQSVMGAHG